MQSPGKGQAEADEDLLDMNAKGRCLLQAQVTHTAEETLNKRRRVSWTLCIERHPGPVYGRIVLEKLAFK